MHCYVAGTAGSSLSREVPCRLGLLNRGRLNCIDFEPVHTLKAIVITQVKSVVLPVYKACRIEVIARVIE